MFGIGDSVVVGYDLSNEYAQISYLSVGDDIAKTISLKPGEEAYNIPLCLFKRSEVNQWFVGNEAVNYSTLEEGQMVEHLWEYALVGDSVEVVGEEFDPISLLLLYIRRTLTLLNTEVKKENIKGIMFTVPELTKRAIEVLDMIVALLNLEGIKIGFQGREESIYHYMLRQPSELWQYDVLVYDYDGRDMQSYRFFLNKKTKPMVALVDAAKHTTLNTSDDEEKDAAFVSVVKNTCDGHIVSCAYLLGDGFEGEWCKDSLRELCRNRRAFRGNNLYSRGACYSMELLLNPPKTVQTVFLGGNKLKANIGMEVIRGGEESYLALLNGGENWFDSQKTVELIIDKGNSFVVTITPLDGRNVRNVEISLEGLNDREQKATRIRLEAVMETENDLRINVTDLGFGEFYPASHQLFTRQIPLTVQGEGISE